MSLNNLCVWKDMQFNNSSTFDVVYERFVNIRPMFYSKNFNPKQDYLELCVYCDGYTNKKCHKEVFKNVVRQNLYL
jgi:hypothetical protein